MIGMGSTAAGASALIGSGAFSRVESHRSVRVQVASDSDAYLKMAEIDGSENSENYVDEYIEEDDGHLEIDIADSGNGGSGVNSNSLTFFDDLFEVCNQGKADARFYIDASELETGDGDIQFYTGTASGSSGTDGITPIASSLDEDDHDDSVAPTIEAGEECENVGLLVDTGKGSEYTDTEDSVVDATEVDTLVDGEVTIVADAEGGAGAD